MKIIVEIGTDEQKELIKEEIYYILSEYKEEAFEIVIPENFDEHIQNKLSDYRFQSYRSSLNQLVMGKLIGENHLVFNPILYTEFFNATIRTTYFLHEYHHIINKKRIINSSANPRDKKLIPFKFFV